MAFNMKRPVIKGSVSHKASIARAQERQSVESDADLVYAASELGRSKAVKNIDYSIDNKDVKFKKGKKKKEKEKEPPIVEEEVVTTPEVEEEVVTTPEVEDNTTSVEQPPNPNDLRTQRAINLASKNFQLKPINIDSQDLRLKKATRSLSDPKVNIGKEEMEVIKKAEEDRRRANDPLLSEINDRRELKKAGPDNVDPLTREILDQSDRPEPDYTPEYREIKKASKIDSIDPKLTKVDIDYDPKFKKAKMLAHEDGKNFVPLNLPDGVSGDFYNGPNKNTYVPSLDDNGNLQVTWNGRVLQNHEIPDEKLNQFNKMIDDKNAELDANDPLLQQINKNRSVGPSAAQKRDDGIWKRAIKNGKAQQNMRKSGYIPPEER